MQIWFIISLILFVMWYTERSEHRRTKDRLRKLQTAILATNQTDRDGLEALL